MTTETKATLSDPRPLRELILAGDVDAMVARYRETLRWTGIVGEGADELCDRYREMAQWQIDARRLDRRAA